MILAVRGARPAVVGLVAAALVTLVPSSTPRAAMELLEEQARADVPLHGESRVVIEGLRGTILVRGEGVDQLRFLSTRSEEDDSEVKVGVWSDGTTLRIAPPPGADGAPRRLEVALPPRMNVTVRAAESIVGIAEIGGTVGIEGTQLEVSALRLDGELDVNVTGGSVYVEDIASSVTLNGGGLDVTLRRVNGLLYGRFEGGTASLSELSGGADLDTTGCKLTVADVSHDLKVRASEGTVDLVRIGGGASLVLAGAPLMLQESSGILQIESDALVRFHDNRADVQVEGYGSDVLGANHSGSVKVTNHGAKVQLEAIDGTVEVHGEGIQVRLDRVSRNVVVRTSSSDIVVNEPGAGVDVESEFGSVEIVASKDKATVVSRDANVRFTEAQGPVEIKADGGLVEVEWARLPEEDSSITNQGGEVRLTLPAGAGCSVDAASSRGKIESDIADLAISEEGDRANGMLHGRAQPRVVVRSAGDVQIVAGATLREKLARQNEERDNP